MRAKVMLTGMVALLLCALLFTALLPQAPVSGAPLAAPTPISITRPGNGGAFKVFDLFATRPITQDTTSTCFDVGAFALADVQYTIDQGTTNTTTLTTKWSVDGGTLVSGVNVVASNAADATDMQQVQTFGRYFCLLADVANTETITITAKAIAK